LATQILLLLPPEPVDQATLAFSSSLIHPSLPGLQHRHAGVQDVAGSAAFRSIRMSELQYGDRRNLDAAAAARRSVALVERTSSRQLQTARPTVSNVHAIAIYSQKLAFYFEQFDFAQNSTSSLR
jgi:hypothetical protein